VPSRRSAPLSVPLSVLVLAVVAALTLGGLGTATAAGLTKKTVKKIATKVVRKQARTLTVANAGNAANAGNLGGKPATSYLDDVTVYTVPVPTPRTELTYALPLPAGSYEISYSAYLNGAGAGYAECFVYRSRGPATFYTAEEVGTLSASGDPGMSGTGVVDVVAGDEVALTCAADSAWTTLGLADTQEPVQIVVTPLDTVRAGTGTVLSGGLPRH
jgi:hypothetical protein